MERKIILNLAISLDGYIADEQGGFDWITGQADATLDTEQQIDFMEFVDTCDVVVMGANAYLDAPENSLDIYQNKHIYVVTNRTDLVVGENVTCIADDVVSQIVALKEQAGKNIFIYGGGQIVNLFTKEDAIDEYIIGIIPTILGNGRKLFFDDNPTIPLHLSKYAVIDGIMLMHYTKR